MRFRPAFAVALALAVPCLLASSLARAQNATATLDIDVSKPGVAIPPNFYGLMTEEINHSYDGGLYAELVQNRSFLDAREPAHWTPVGGAKITLDKSNPATPALPVSARIDLNGQQVGIANDGYWGIPVKPETKYTASFYVKGGGGFHGPVTASIVGDDGTEYAKADSAAVTDQWQRLTVPLTTKSGISPTTKAKFVVSANGTGSVSFTLVSLFPPTYQDTPNGLRPDLMKLMADMKPSFIRLPGGNYLEGNDFPNRFDWKRMIGPVENRPGHQSCWGYRSTDGFGLPEYLLWCKQLNAEPILAVFAGYTLNHDHVDAGSPQMKQYAEEAVQEIEYVTGGPDTEWGKKRVADGFPEPFKLTYVEIGNEDWFDRSPSYDGRFTEIYDAIKAKYPNLKLIATAPVHSRKPDLYDDHYYRSPNDMARDWLHYAPGDKGPLHYDGGRFVGTVDPKGPKTFVGEWASQDGKPTPTLRSALGDAVWLMGLETTADQVPIECYAPLLVNVNPRAWQWGTNLIGYDAMTAFGSPSYYAQALFGQNKGDVVLPANLQLQQEQAPAAPPAPHGAVGVGTWDTNVEYKDMTVTGPDGKALLPNDPTQSINGWHFDGGEWTVADGVLKPAGEPGHSWGEVGDPSWTDYVYKVKARKTGGDEGFLILWHAGSPDNMKWMNIGGWGNTRTTAENETENNRGAYGPNSNFKVETGKWYDIRVEVKGKRAQLYIDNKLITDATEPAPAAPTQPLFASASKVTASGEVIIKVVNVSGNAFDATLNLQGASRVTPTGKAFVIAGQPGDVNTVAEPTKVATKEESLTDAGNTFKRTFPAYSVTLLRIQAK